MNTSAVATRTAVMPHLGSMPAIPRMSASLAVADASLTWHAASRRAPRAWPAGLPHLFRRNVRRPDGDVDADRHPVLAGAPAHELPVPARPDVHAAVRADPPLLDLRRRARRPRDAPHAA